MTGQALEARNAYRRKWYAENKDKQKQYNERYWNKKAEQAAATVAQETPEPEKAIDQAKEYRA